MSLSKSCRKHWLRNASVEWGFELARANRTAQADVEPVEGLWDLPDGWRWERLENVAPVNPRRNFDQIAENASVTFLPMAAVTELTGALKLDERRPLATVRSGFTRFRSGDVIFAKITPCMENGKMAIIPELPHGMGAGSTEFHVLEPQQVDGRYLYHWLSQRTFRQNAEHNMTGTAGQKRVPTEWLRSAAIPVPPTYDEQRLAVDRIETLFDEIDEGEAALADARAGVESYRNSLLKAAVMGNLTADWPRDNPQQESGGELLDRILTERRARWEADPKNARKKYAEPVGPDTDGLPSLPYGWVWANLDQLATHEVRNGLSVKDTPEPSEVRALRLGALGTETIDWSIFRYLPVSRQSVAKYELIDGDLLVSRANGSPLLVGRAALCIAPPEDMIFPDTAIRFRLLGGDAMRQWVVKLWNSLLIRAQINQLAKTTAGILKISQGDISRIAIPIPGEMELLKINQLIEAKLADVGVADQIEPVEIMSATLRQSILAAAFRGELTA